MSTASPAPAPESAPAPAPSARRQATRERLLEAAAAVFVEAGLQGASVEAVCHRAGFTRGAFYSNFSSKEELFLALLEREFEHRTANIRARTAEMIPAMRADEGCIDPEQAAAYIAEFLAPGDQSAAWCVLETELALLAMRDPESVPGYADLISTSYSAITGLVETAIAAAGRRFTLAAPHAVAVLAGEYDRSLRMTVLQGASAPGALHDLPALISDLLFAITEPIPA